MNAAEAPGPTWQRWTIDEIDSGIARVAVARTDYGLDPDVAEAFDSGADVQALRQAVFTAEDVPPEHVWGDEEAAFLPVKELGKLLRRRSRIRGLPGRRALREGDVFWIVLPPDLDPQLLAALEPAELPARAEELRVQVWDVTAAARQAAKRTYDRAVRAAAPDDDTARRRA